VADITSRPYFTGEPDKCCDACVFGRGDHAAYCAQAAAVFLEADEHAGWCLRQACGICGRYHGTGEPHYLPPCRVTGCPSAAAKPRGSWCVEHCAQAAAVPLEAEVFTVTHEFLLQIPLSDLEVIEILGSDPISQTAQVVIHAD